MIIQIVKFESALSEDEVLATAKERADQFRSLPGLLQKYYVKLGQPNQYGGVYLWDSMESLSSYRESDLAASIPTAYKVMGPPTVEILDTLFQLRE
jgi:heme-degrading monooxygenase HmoA